MADRYYVLGLFRDGNQAAAVVETLRNAPWNLEKVHSPFPHHGILEALRLKKSKVGYFTLAGGVFGFFAGLALSVFTAVQWNLIVSGKPVVALIPFFIVGFEFTILFSVLGNIVGFLTQARLPNFKGLKIYDPRCSGNHFGVLASCAPGDEEGLKGFFQERGGESQLFDGSPEVRP
jgi:molybdopterin-containing oxidoreductase family membrane subunit